MLKFFKKKKTISIKAPVTGTCIELKEVPDEVFANKMVGDGVAIKPSNGLVLSPCDGEIMQIFPTKHAIGILSQDGIEILIHIGIDTVNLKGEGFDVLVNVGDKVTVGLPIMRVDLGNIESNAKSIISPIIITNMYKVEKIALNHGPVSSAESDIITLTLK